MDFLENLGGFLGDGVDWLDANGDLLGQIVTTFNGSPTSTNSGGDTDTLGAVLPKGVPLPMVLLFGIGAVVLIVLVKRR